IKQKEDKKCIHWKSLRDLIFAHQDTKKRVDIFALSIYGLVIFPKALGYIDEAASDLFNRHEKRVTPVPVEKVFYRVLFENYSPLKELVATPRRDNILEEKWMGKTSKQWRQEIKEENIKADQWEKKFQDARVRENALERDLLESQNENVGLRAWVAELERSLHQYRSHNFVIELKASLNKIEELKGKIEELETALQNCEL
ncbi:hypothetical protein Gotri_016102, partial [Gossypium trilobum]|nr:hypothetical protein [Gossypium trilobum]